MGRIWPFKSKKAEAPPPPEPKPNAGRARTWATSERLKQFVRDHDHVEGYFGKHDLLVWDAFLEFQEREGIEGHMLEIGVLKGRSAFFSSLFAGANEQCWFVDMIMDPEFRRVLEARMPENTHFLEASSYDVAKEPETHFTGIGEFRWIHIDGQHTATAVVNDLELAERLLSPKGVISVDDFLSPTWPHVAAGVFRYLHENPGRVELVLTAYNKGYLARPDSVAYYQRFLREDLATHFKSRNFDEYMMIEVNLHDADDGVHCLGVGLRHGDWEYVANDNWINWPEPSPEPSSESSPE